METYRRHKRVPDPRPYVDEMRDRPATVPSFEDWRRSLKDLSGLGYSEQEQEQIRREICWLFRHFQAPVIFGARFHAPCPIWRSERIVLRDDILGRFAPRLCLFHGDPEYMNDHADPSGQVDQM